MDLDSFLFPERASKRTFRNARKCVLLHEFAVLSRPQGLQNEVNIEPETIEREKWREKGPESREESDFEGKSHMSSMLYSHPTVKRTPLPLARVPVFLWIA